MSERASAKRTKQGVLGPLLMVPPQNRNPAFHIGVLADELGDEGEDWFYGKLVGK